MIYGMHLDVRDKLRTRGYPVEVHYGPERAKRKGGHHSVIVIERERPGSDAITAPQGTNQNPRKYATFTLGVVARVFARSNVDAAHVGNHEDFCEQLVRALIVAVTEWCIEARAGMPTFTAAGYVEAKEFDDLEQWPGVVYELRFRISSGVFAVNYDGSARPTGTPLSVSNRTDVRYTGQPDSEPEVGCGGD